MSTIPLSKREGYGRTLSGRGTAIEIEDDDALGDLIARVTDAIGSRGEAGRQPMKEEGFGSESGLQEGEATNGASGELDHFLQSAVAGSESRQADSEDFQASRPWRDLLARRYGGRVAIGDLLDAFAHWHDRFRDDPRAAGDALASAYLEQSPQALPQEDASVTDTAAAGGVADRAAPLDRILDAAIDRHHGAGDGERETFIASEPHRAALKAMFPGLSYAEACRRVVCLDRDLHRDPIGTAARLAASYGLPVTASQHARAERAHALDHVHALVASLKDQLPELADLHDDIVDILDHADFTHGPDLQQNLVRAYRVAHHRRQTPQG